jgi:hypothetical protein
MILAHFADRAGQIHPNVVILAFIGSDLSADRTQNHVDRFGYLTKNVFGPRSYWADILRAVARESHLALLTKDAMLRSRMIQTPDFALDEKLTDFRKEIARFDALTAKMRRVVICLDLRESLLTRKISGIMQAEFSHLTYIHAPYVLDGVPLEVLRVPRDGHPNANAHKIYAELLWPAVVKEIRTR